MNKLPLLIKKAEVLVINDLKSDSNNSCINVQDSDLFIKESFLDRLEENNANVKMEITTTIKTEIQNAHLVVRIEIKQANMEDLKSVEQIFTIF